MLNNILSIIPNERDWKELQARGVQSSLSQIIVAAVFYALHETNLNSQNGQWSLLFIIAFSLVRFFFNKSQTEVNSKNFVLYFVIACIQSFSWAAFIYDSITLYDPAGFNRVLGYMVMAAIMSGATQSLGNSLILFLSYQLILLYPTHVMFVKALQNNWHNVIEPISVYMFFLFLVGQRKSQLNLWRLATNTEQDLQSIINNFPGAISLVRNGKYVHANNNVAHVSGLKLDQILNQPVGQQRPDEEIPKLINELQKDAQQKLLVKEISFNTEDGNKEHIVFLNRLENKDIVIISLDISQQKAIEKELEYQKIKAENNAKMAALGEMAAGVAHEINNPLAIIKVKSQILKNNFIKDKLDKKFMNNQIDSITNTVNRIASIVRGLRNFARDGEKDPYEQTLVSNIINDTLSLCEARLQNDNIQIRKINTDSLTVIDCRSVQVSQVLLNLLNNAHDAIENTADKWIEIEVMQKENVVSISVTDSGHGIPVDIREKLMQPFFTTKEIGKGTGLGLSLSKGLIESHGGKLYFDFNAQNTKAIIELPIKQTSPNISQSKNQNAA